MELNANLPMAPSGWRVREALSYDLPFLWPAEYEATVRRFEQAGVEERAAFLRRTGVRRCVLPVAEPRQCRVVAEVPDWNMRVFDCDPGAARVLIASAVEIARDPADLAWQREALFDPALPDDVARLPEMPVTSAAAGTPEPSATRIVEDGGDARRGRGLGRARRRARPARFVRSLLDGRGGRRPVADRPRQRPLSRRGAARRAGT